MSPAPLFCVGAAVWDAKLQTLGPAHWHSSNPARTHLSPGGVARNIAENLARLGLPVQLQAPVADDADGRALHDHAQALGITPVAWATDGGPTGRYTAVLDDQGDLLIGLADMAALDELTPARLAPSLSARGTARVVVADLNLPQDTVAALIQDARATGVPLVLVAVSEPKMRRLPQDLRGVDLLVLNRGELAATVGRPLPDTDSMHAAHEALARRGLAHLVVSDGAAALWWGEARTPLQAIQPPSVTIQDVSGAGDALSAGIIAGRYALRRPWPDACQLGLRMAALTLASADTVSSALSPEVLSP